MGQLLEISAAGKSYRELNGLIKQAVGDGVDRISLSGVRGQRYIGTGVKNPVNIQIHGVPGSDLNAFGDGADIEVFGNAQEAVGNTLNSGTIVVHGHVNDVLGVSMRGGNIFVRDYAGYRTGIHMKAYRDMHPTIVIGGTVQNFLGEYMAGGTILVLGLNTGNRPVAGDYIGTGMHGGVIYLRGEVENDCLGKEVSAVAMQPADYQTVAKLSEQYFRYFPEIPVIADIERQKFTKLVPVSHRPYGLLYVP